MTAGTGITYRITAAEKTDSTSQAIARPKYSVLASEYDIRLPVKTIDEAIAESLAALQE